MAENVPKLVLTAVFSAIVWLSVEPPIDRVISVGELLSGSVMIKVKTVDYETTKNLSITVRVTDVNLNTFDKTFTFNIANVNDETPSDITLTGSQSA
jgi:hypothetical protein